MSGKANPRMAMEALHRTNGDRQKAWSEYIRLHFRSTGSLAPGCDAKDFYTCLDVQTLELWKAAKAVVESSIHTGQVNVSAPAVELSAWVRTPEHIWRALEALV